MKKTLFFILTAATVALFSCGEKKETPAIAGMMDLDLSSHGVPVIITVPDSSKGKVEVEDASGPIKIRVGKSFRLSIFEEAGDRTLKKSDITSAEPKKFKRDLVEEPTTIVYENQLTDPEFHFYTIVKTGEKTFVLEDLDGEEIYTEEQAKMMLESAKNIKLSEAKGS